MTAPIPPAVHSDHATQARPWRWSLVALCLVVASVYFLVSLRYSGPAYLADEIGYLSNAAFLGGYASHGGSSYYAGYSLLIAPVFWLANDPAQVWMAVLAINALMWALTLWLVSGLLVLLVPDASPWKRLLALVVIACYPGYVAMAGYAFSQSAFALFFTLAVLTIAHVRVDKAGSAWLHAIVVGYLCCIHPAGFPVAIASLLTLAVLSWRGRQWKAFLVALVVISVIVLVYHQWVHPAMVAQMTPDGGGVGQHYPGAKQLLKWDKLSEQIVLFLSASLGQLSYVLLATFGFAGLGTAAIFRTGIKAWPSAGSDEVAVRRAAVCLLLVLSLVGVIAESAIASAAGGGPDRVDQWIYGRYLEPMLATLLGLGLLSPARRWWTVFAALTTLLVGAYLVHGVKMDGQLYVMNVAALWPLHVGWGGGTLSWFVLGAAAIVLAAMLNRTLVMLAIAGIYLACVPTQQSWHSTVLRLNSNPSDIPEFVAANYTPGQCVGFDTRSSARLPVNYQERANLYSFYLYESPLLRLSPEQWYTQCAGPLLTFNAHLDLPHTRYVGREKFSKLYVLVKERQTALSFPHSQPDEQVWLAPGGDESCLLAGCFEKERAQFSRHSQVGSVNEDGIRTDGRAGFLSFGPYAYLSAGNYLLQMEGDFDEVSGVQVDVISGNEPIIHTDVALSHYLAADRHVARIPFELKDDTPRIEVRIRTSAKDKLLLRRYEVLVNTTNIRSEPPKLAHFEGPQLAQLPHQVGVASSQGWRSDGRAGFLLFGPYKQGAAGRYQLTVHGKAGASMDAWVDVVTAAGRTSHTKVKIPAGGNGKLVDTTLAFSTDVNDLEVRVHVGASDQIEISSYSLSKIP